MKILFINNIGAGFADQLEIPAGLTVDALFKLHLPQKSPNGYLIRVNRQNASADQILQEGDRVSFTPTKIEGAILSV